MGSIKFIGIGEQGLSTATHLFRDIGLDVSRVMPLIIGTDQKWLERHAWEAFSPEYTMLLAPTACKSVAARKPGHGRRAMPKGRRAVASCLEGTEIAIICGEVGHEAEASVIPVLVDLCHEMGVLDLVMVTTPSSLAERDWPGITERAQAGVAALRKNATSLFVVDSNWICRVLRDRQKNWNMRDLVDAMGISALSLFGYKREFMDEWEMASALLGSHAQFMIDIAEMCLIGKGRHLQMVFLENIVNGWQLRDGV